MICSHDWLTVLQVSLTGGLIGSSVVPTVLARQHLDSSIKRRAALRADLHLAKSCLFGEDASARRSVSDHSEQRRPPFSGWAWRWLDGVTVSLWTSAGFFFKVGQEVRAAQIIVWFPNYRPRVVSRKQSFSGFWVAVLWRQYDTVGAGCVFFPNLVLL